MFTKAYNVYMKPAVKMWVNLRAFAGIQGYPTGFRFKPGMTDLEESIRFNMTDY